MSTLVTEFPIQGLWIGKLGLLERLSIASFIAHGHHYDLYVYEDQENIPAGVRLCDASEILPSDMIFQYRYGPSKGGYSGFANLFRYRLLQLKGGWWCDTDLICLKPFNFTSEMVFASERHWLWGKKICNNVIFCPPGHPFMTSCYEDAARFNPETLRHAANGAPVLRRNINKFKLKRYVKRPDTFNPVNWYDSELIGKSGSLNLLPEASFSLHCYREIWRWHLKDMQEEKFRNHLFPADTLLGSLQRKYLHDEHVKCL